MKQKFKSTSLAITAMMVIAACSADPGNPDILTAEYLQGEWCYEQYEASGAIEEQNITYRFAVDGTLLYQAESGAPVDQAGTFEIGRTGLLIRPEFSLFPPMRAQSMEDDRLRLLTQQIELLWTRGACSE